jgi:DNA-binding IclR family transcriptional regulator
MTDRPGLDMINKADGIISVLDTHGELTAVQVAELVDEPVSSTYRLLTALSRIGWVDRGSKRGLFRLGLFFMNIGGLVEDRLDIRECARPAMQELIATTGHTTYLCVRREDRAVCIERLNGREIRSLAMRLGDSLPMYTGAAPRALLAFLPQSEQAALVDHYVAPDSPWANAPSREEIESMIEATRARGYSVSDEDVTPGVASIGAPVFNHRGELEGSISISNIREPIMSESGRMAAAVIEAARRVSGALGYEPGRLAE